MFFLFGFISLGKCFFSISRASELSLPESHSQEEDTSVCTNCHETQDTINRKGIQSYDHTGDWSHTHQFSASQGNSVCQLCHNLSFCTDCHVRGDELMPSIKNRTKPYLNYPHRGDFLFRHRIDGKMKSAQCYKCHKRQNSQRCFRCHKNAK